MLSTHVPLGQLVLERGIVFIDLAIAQVAGLGVVFVVAASAEIILLSYNPHGAEHLKDLLVGQILWVEPAQLIPVLVLYAVVVAALIFLDIRRRRVTFYALFAVTITASVQLVGVFLVFASLIVPALAAHAAPRRLRLTTGYAVGFTGYVLGLLASALYDFPTGAAIVCVLAIVGAATPVVLDRARRSRSPSSSGRIPH